MGKDIYVFAQRIGESEATNKLLSCGEAKAIYNIEEFVSTVCEKSINDSVKVKKADDFLEFCKCSPTYEDAVKKFPDRVFEAELSGTIEIVNAMVYLKS